jgi:transposase
VHAAEQQRPDVHQARLAWRVRQRTWSSERLVFLDETGLNTKLGRLYGRALGGERCLGALPHGHWRTSTLVAALRTTGLVAPLLLDGPMDGAMFLAYLRPVLSAELRPGDLVICDNLASHRVFGVADAIVACGATLHYLPAYSPDLNPIEMAFSKLKAHLRCSAARTLPALVKATAAALDAFTPEQCRNFFTHAQYATN